MDTLVGLCIGIGIAAACGFRVSVPLLVLGLGGKAGLVHLSEHAAFLATTPGLMALATASVLEVGAYWIPSVDHALDVIATPAAVVAGTIAAASQLGDLGPLMSWGSALVAGGGVAAATQTVNVSARGVSTLSTAGILNPIISAVQSAAAVVLSVLAVVVPVAAGALILGAAILGARWYLRRRERRAAVCVAG